TSGSTLGYWGDYTYNQNFGDMNFTSSPVAINTPFEKFNEVPGNVLVMTDIDKQYGDYYSSPPKYETNMSIFLETNYLLGNHWATWSVPFQAAFMWFPHTKGTQANGLFIDGHVSLLSPNDFVLPNGGAINIKTIPWTYTPSISGIQTKNWIIGYYKAGNSPPWVTPWNKFAPGL
ncbi:MAG: hypothetical protein ABSH08_18870, partial [Tepidisphaeraceae bacterium]